MRLSDRCFVSDVRRKRKEKGMIFCPSCSSSSKLTAEERDSRSIRLIHQFSGLVFGGYTPETVCFTCMKHVCSLHYHATT